MQPCIVFFFYCSINFMCYVQPCIIIFYNYYSINFIWVWQAWLPDPKRLGFLWVFFLILCRLIFFHIDIFIRFFVCATLHCFFLNYCSINFMCYVDPCILFHIYSYCSINCMCVSVSIINFMSFSIINLF